MLKKIIFVMLIFLFVALTTKADRRKYVWTYQYGTIAPGAAELELYQTTQLDAIDSWEYRIEIEHGLTRNWDLSIYQIFTQKENETFKWDAFQIRTRYRLASQGKYFFNPLFYLEYNRKVDLEKQNKLEMKLILSKNIDKTNIAINPVYEFFWAPGKPEHELGLDIGFSYELSYKLSLGMETTVRVKYLKDSDNTTSSYMGPTFSFASGPIYYTVGYVWGLTDNSSDTKIRFLMGVDL